MEVEMEKILKEKEQNVATRIPVIQAKSTSQDSVY